METPPPGEHAQNLGDEEDEVRAVEDPHPPHRRERGRAEDRPQDHPDRVLEVERDDPEGGDEAEQGQDGVALLERDEHLDAEDGSERGGKASPLVVIAKKT